MCNERGSKKCKKYKRWRKRFRLENEEIIAQKTKNKLMEKKMSKIQVVWFRDLDLWDFKSNNFDRDIFKSSKFPLIRISTFLNRNKTQVRVQDNELYKRVTIKTKGQGIFLRDELLGKNIGTKNQFLVREGQFLISKIDARNGSFGIATKEVDLAIITGNFWTYDIDINIVNPHFVALLTTTEYFIDFCDSCSGGTTGRHYLDENKFLHSTIPLPPLEIQNKIVADIHAVQDKIKALQEEEKRLKDEIEAYIYNSWLTKATKYSKTKGFCRAV